MATYFMSELAVERAASNRSIASIARESERRKDGALAARKITARALERGPDAREAWQEFQDELKAGLSGEKAAAGAAVVIEVAVSWLELAEVARGLADEAGDADRLADLAPQEAEVRQVRDAATKVRDFLTRPMRPVDAERLARGETDLAEGRYHTGEQIRAVAF